MLEDARFERRDDLAGVEIELHLVDDHGAPLFRNQEVLAATGNMAVQSELGSFNVELNVPPRGLSGTAALGLEGDMRAMLNAVERRAQSRGIRTLMVGILPTLEQEHLLRSDWMSPSARYEVLNDAILGTRGKDLRIDIRGEEELVAESSTLAPESACTSVQLHLQVSPHLFARTWNTAQVLAGPQVALGANSPFLFGRSLWQETRIELFRQTTDATNEELARRGVKPRVWFGERWITSVYDLFVENIRHFPVLIPEMSQEDPRDVFSAGGTPLLQELRLHNGTIYRWNRPVYDVGAGGAHLRVENRVLPAGPTVVDVVANAMFFYGALWEMRSHDPPLWMELEFADALENFERCARWGLEARITWPRGGVVPVRDLVLDTLLPLAHAGLERHGVDRAVRERYLGIVERRAVTGRNGAWWQVATVRALEASGADRRAALTGMLRCYRVGMHANEPVHTWRVPSGG